MKYRQERAASLIKEELAKIIFRNLEFSDCLVTITNVEIDAKFNQAIINFSVLCPYGTSPEGRPSGPACRQAEKSEKILKILKKNRSHLQYLLLKKINIKPMPQIVFEIDYGLEKAARIEKLLLEGKMKK